MTWTGAANLGGSCHDVPTIWSSTDSAETWLVTQPLGTTDDAVGTISKLSIDPSGATVDIRDRANVQHRFITRDTVTWEPIDAVGQVVGILPDAVITTP